MSIPWLVIVYLSALQIHGFDIDRKLWKDKAKSDEAETELTDFGSNMGGRSIPLLSDKLSDLDNSIESRLTKDTPDFARRGLPLFEEDELQNQNDAIEPYLTKETPEFVDRGLSPLEDEQQNLDDAVEAYEPKDDPGLTERGLPLFEDAYDAVEAYMDKDISDPVERGLPLFDDEQQGLEELNGDDPDMDKRNSLTIFDMFNDIANRLDDIQGQIDELREGKKLGKNNLLLCFEL